MSSNCKKTFAINLAINLAMSLAMKNAIWNICGKGGQDGGARQPQTIVFRPKMDHSMTAEDKKNIMMRKFPMRSAVTSAMMNAIKSAIASAIWRLHAMGKLVSMP
mmetsp:Transcript_35732/g.70799  ORF Transcript_35732/g.70799 Transcript_35732/m.70799 type:complete len:105 (-) Transcript_35732:6308-6622(-)